MVAQWAAVVNTLSDKSLGKGFRGLSRQVIGLNVDDTAILDDGKCTAGRVRRIPLLENLVYAGGDADSFGRSFRLLSETGRSDYPQSQNEEGNQFLLCSMHSYIVILRLD